MSSPYNSYAITSVKKALNALKTILEKAEAHAKEKSIALDDLFNARLYEDMRPLSFQIWAATSNAEKVVFRPRHLEPPAREQTDQTFEDLYKRIDVSLGEIANVDVADIVANEDKPFKAPLGPKEIEFKPVGYAVEFALPNVFFHVVTAYNILRKEGVPLGKMDYLKNFLELY
ncbi:hypothetical protein BJY01DRAFT_203486 [Aspergillus pseudoustus]|uniref:DUF1993 domain-containing protein n=1 Tax=Aspergillus pseudoustus TaxID=1810923 RepID=A0ABR4KW74_9EURO